jgi:hypothetical protein
MAKRKMKPESGDGLVAPGESGKLEINKRENENLGRSLARVSIDTQIRNADLASMFAAPLFATDKKPDIMESSAVVAEEMQRTAKGDMTLASRIFTAQALSLDAIFTELARRSASNLGAYPIASERYMRLAFKAQSACRATLEALAKLHQPREQTVRHVHVNDGGQAVIADNFHHHRNGGRENAGTAEQPHAPDGGAAGSGPAMLGHDPQGNGLPISGDQGREAMQDARRQGQRRA